VEQDKPAATPGDETGGLDAAQRLAAYLREDESRHEEFLDEESPDEEHPHEEPVEDELPIARAPARPDRVPSAPRSISAPEGVPLPASAWAGICPYLIDGSGTWRAAQPSRDHVCTAVTPAEPLRAEKQRRLCLGAGHLDCPLLLAAREDRARSLGDVAAVPAARPFARTAPVILQRPAAVAVALSTLRTSLPQVGLVILMLLGAAALVLARFVTP
jgi:hypothetical protein